VIYMESFKKKQIIFVLILMQTMLAVVAGITASYLAWDGTDDCAIFIGENQITGLSRENAKKLLKDFYDRIIEQGSIKVTIDGKTFNIGYREIGVEIEWEQALDKAYRDAQARPFLFGFIEGISSERQVRVQPGYSINKGLLTDRIREISGVVFKDPTDAKLLVEKGSVIKIPEENGYKLDIGIIVEIILDDFNIEEGLGIAFRPDLRTGFRTVAAEKTLEDFKGLDCVISECSIPIGESDYKNDLIKLAERFSGLIIEKTGNQEHDFSYRSTVTELISTVNAEAHNQMASAIYKAFLCMGIEIGGIVRFPCSVPRKYTDAGLEACVDEYDLAVSDISIGKIMIWTQADDKTLTVSLIGPEAERNKSYSLRTEIEQVIDSPVIYVQDSSLGRDEKKVAEPGMAGLKVNVYRKTAANGDASEELLYTDIYRPVSMVVKVGHVDEKTASQK
jgi:vancomycin resistance protein YoaR